MEPKNVTRSKKLIKDAVLELILEKNPADIKVTEITSLAEINRGTFYSHYNTIFDVISEIEDDIINNFLFPPHAASNSSMVRPSPTSTHPIVDFTYIEEMLNHGYKHQDIILKNYKRNLFPNLMVKMKEHIYQHIMQYTTTPSPDQIEIDYKIIVSFMLSGYVGLITDWASGDLGKNITPEIIFPYIKKMILKLSEMRS